ncbi:MAG: thioredoxin family protein [Verrucomicrobiota bacterium]
MANPTQTAKSATIAKVNVDESPDLARRFGIQSIPTFAIFKNGELVEQFSGVTTKQKLQDHLN